MRPTLITGACAATLIALSCGPGPVDKDPEEMTQITTTNGATNGDDGETNGATNGNPNGDTNGGTNGDSEPVCEFFYERVVGDECVRVERYMTITATRHRGNDPEGEPTDSASLVACPYVATGNPPASTSNPPDYEDGACRAWLIGGETSSTEPAYEGDPTADVGEVTVQTPTGTIELTRPNDTHPCVASDSMEMPFDAGETLTVEVTGGSDMPAFSSEIEVPELPVFSTTDALPGEPIEFTWEPRDREEMFLYFQAVKTVDNASTGVVVVCDTEDDGSLTIPGEAIEYMPDDPSFLQYSISRQTIDSHFEGDVLFHVTGNADTRKSQWPE